VGSAKVSTLSIPFGLTGGLPGGYHYLEVGEKVGKTSTFAEPTAAPNPGVKIASYATSVKAVNIRLNGIEVATDIQTLKHIRMLFCGATIFFRWFKTREISLSRTFEELQCRGTLEFKSLVV